MLHILEHSIIDSLKLLPFLFLTYFIIELIEHKTGDKSKEFIKKSGRFGPLIGSLVGIFPQCGFSVSATTLYASRVITLGTLISVYLSTSDEMLPILISESVPIDTILKILAIKIFIGMLTGFILDLFLFSVKKKAVEENKIEELCKHDHCHCENGLLKSSIKHTLNVFIFILIITLLLNSLIHIIGEENLANFILNKPILGPIISGLIGLIPNCASSVILTQLYLSNVITVGTMLGGLLVNSGVALIILFKINKNLKENLSVIGILYIVGVLSAIIMNFINLSF